MIFKRSNVNVFLRVLFLFATLLALAFLLVREEWLFAAYIIPLVIIALIYFFRYPGKIDREMDEFVKAVHYRDFTRSFAWQRSPAGLRALHKGFNELNAAFTALNREKETQYQYLQKIIALMDTGVLSFNVETGHILWMNESLKRLLNIPYLKNIERLDGRNNDLLAILKAAKTGESKVIALQRENNSIKIQLNITAFQTDGNIYKLVSFQNVDEALDATESQAWQRLLSVMTHEIMNSVAPIASLADTLKKRLQRQELEHNNSLYEDLELGIDTIKRRSEGLTKFAETYRNLSKISHLDKTEILVRDLLENIYQLMDPTLRQKNIELEIVLRETGLLLEADKNLLEQVLINLILNAVEAVKEKTSGTIILSAAAENKEIILSVTDNGKGIAPDLLDKIFVPFFSTRKNGNGIGLSLCKQIMLLHGGNIQVRTLAGTGTSFRLIFKKNDS